MSKISAIILFMILFASMASSSLVYARQGCGYGRHYCYARGYCVTNGTVCQQHWYHGCRYIPSTGRRVCG